MIKFYLFLIITFVLVFIYDPENTYASPPPPAPKCKIEGTIKKIRHELSYENPCVRQNSCPTDMEVKRPERFYLSVDIKKVALLGGSTQFYTCEGLFPLNSVKEIFINKDKVINNDVFEKGQSISGVTSGFGSSQLETYNLSRENSLGGFLSLIFNFINSLFQ